jgi:hypothetical protein
MKRKQKQKKISFEIPADLYRDDLISLLLEYDSFKDYLVDLVKQDVTMMLVDGGLDMRLETRFPESKPFS